MIISCTLIVDLLIDQAFPTLESLGADLEIGRYPSTIPIEIRSPTFIS